MPIVKMPDGTNVSFPDEMPREQIRDMIASKFPEAAGPQPGIREQAQAFAGSALEGIPIAGPYIKAGVERARAGFDALRNDTPFSQELAEAQGSAKANVAAFPKTALAGGVAGGVLGTIPMVAAAPGLFGAGAGSILARGGASLVSGAAIGAGDAAVRTGGDLEGIKEGAKWGGGLGLAGPLVGAGAGKIVGAVLDRTPAAAKMLGRAAAADGLTPQQAAAQLDNLGSAAMPADLGPNLQRQAGALAATPGRAQEVLRTAIADRQAGAGTRVAGATDAALGQNVDTLALAEDIITKRAAAAQPLYDAAYAKPMPDNKTVAAILTTPAGKSAWAKAEQLAANEGLPIDAAAPTVRALDLTKRSLDDMVSAAKRAGNGNEARIIEKLNTQLVKSVDGAVPEYAVARQAFAGPSAVIDALEEGAGIFDKALTPNQLRSQLLKMGATEKDAFTQGARNAVADIMGTARNDALAARNTFAKGYNREKLEVLVGKPQAKQMLDSLEAETAFSRTRDVVTGNSETYARQQAGTEVAMPGGVNPSALRSAGNFQFGDAVASILGKATGGARNARQQQVNAQLAELLTAASTDRAKVADALRAVGQARGRGEIAEAQAKQLVQALALSSSGDLANVAR